MSVEFKLNIGTGLAVAWPKMIQQTNDSWFVIAVRSNYERAVTSCLLDRGYETYLPLYCSRRVWSDRKKEVAVPLFPGYTFSRFDPARRLPILQIPAVREIVGSRPTGPISVDEREINALRAMLAAGLPVGPFPYLREGSYVTVERGPLTGVEGIIVEFKSKYRLVVSVTLLQRSVYAEIDRDWVVPRKNPQVPTRHGAHTKAQSA